MVVEVKREHLNRKLVTEIWSMKLKYNKRGEDKRTDREIFSGLKLISETQETNAFLGRDRRTRGSC